MKKTLAAVAVLGAFAGSALAADVQLYGIVDMGLNYTHIDGDGAYEDMDSFSMESGQQSGSRWGIKGTEDLGNGLTVGFVLEDGFSADTGSEGTNPMFDRESMLFLQGGFGKVAFGRIGSFNQGQGSFSKIGMLTPFGTSFGDYAAQAGNVFASSTRYENSIVYETPSFAGFQVTAMYSMGNTGDDGVENESSSERYYGIAATYKNGPAAAYLAIDSTNYKSWGETHGSDMEDAMTVTLGGSWDFEVVKAYIGAQYFDEVKVSSLGGIIDNNAYSVKDAAGKVTFSTANLKVTGYSVLIGADAPLAGGKLMAAAAYMDGEQSDFEEDYGAGKFDFTRWVISAGYDYPLSKRTNVYAVASYMDDELEGKGANNGADWNPSAYTFMVGMRHKF